MPRLYQGSFSAGELGPGLWGRVDLDRFSSGLRVCRNMFPMAEGGAVKRPGLQFVGFSVDGVNESIRLVPFKFNNEQTYMMAFQESSFTIVKDGGVILEATTTGTLSAGQDGSGTYFLDGTAGFAASGITSGVEIFVTSGGFDEIEGRWLRVASSPAPTTSKVYLVDYVTGDALPTSGWTSAGAPVFAPILKYATADGWFNTVPVDELDFTQANDKIYVSHGSDETKVITRTSDTSWTIVDFDPSPANAAPTAAEDSLTGSIYDGTGLTKPTGGGETADYAITSIDNTTFEESLATLVTVSDVDLALFAPPAATGTGASLAITWASGTDRFRIYKSVGGIYGLIGQVEGTSGTLYFDDIGYTPNLSIAPPLEVAPEFNASGGFPGAVELFQQRIWFGRTDDELRDIYASRSGSLSSFSTTTVSTDDDPISMKIAAKSVNEVRYFVPLRDLVVMTSDAEWGFDTGDVGVLTPGSGLIAHSYWGSARVKPAIVGDSAVFVEKSGQTIRDLAFQLQNDGFASSNLSLLAKHLFAGRTVKSICFAENPFNLLFCVMSDGAAVSCTYVRDQQIFAWARHDTGGKMLDCASVTEDGLDNIYVTVQRITQNAAGTDVGYTQIERMVMREPDFVDRGIHLDNSKAFNQATSTDNTSFASATRVETVSGVQQLQVNLLSSTPDNSKLSINNGPATAASARLQDLSIMVVGDGNPSGGREWHTVYRALNNSTTDRVLADWELFLPSANAQSTLLGYYKLGTGTLLQAHHLVYRPGYVAVRADDTMYTGLTIPEGGEYEFDATQEAGVIHAGETYIAEIETLDIDSIADPITGRPIQVGELLVRFGLTAGYKTGRDRNVFADRTLTQLRTEEAFDPQLGALRGVTKSTLFPNWKRRGRVIIRSEDGFPMQISAVVPIVDTGDLDD